MSNSVFGRDVSFPPRVGPDGGLMSGNAVATRQVHAREKSS